MGVRREVVKKGVAAGGIKLTENIVEEIDGCFRTTLVEEIALGELECKGDGALLAFTGVVAGRHAVEAD